MKTRLLTTAALLWAAAALPAHADAEYWGWWETRIPVHEAVSLRLVSDLRYGTRYPGLGLSFFRVGPLWHVHPNCFVGTHFTTIGIQDGPASFMQEYRLEVEPNFFGRLGDFAWNDRNRLEYRWRWNDQHFRYRNQLRVAYQPAGATVMPYVWDEPMIELTAQGFAQNRLEAGVSWQANAHVRVDVGPMWRVRANGAGGWDHDWILNTYVLFAPKL